MKFPLRSMLLVGISSVASCSDDSGSTTGPTGGVEALQVDLRPQLTVMSRNLYIGTDVDAVIGALTSPDPGDDIPALLGAIATLQETDFPTRARALAEEIARHRPHVVGLQEVSTVDIDLTPLGVPIVLSLDFLSTLLSELAARGLPYVLAAQVTNITAAPLPGIRLADHDAILIDPTRVTPGSLKTEQNFATNIGVVAPGVEIKRGYVVISATIDGEAYVIANTHLESGSAPGLDQLRGAQATELAAVLGNAARVVILGDLNEGPGSLMYRVLSEAGFTDAWAVLRPRKAGYTCCHLPDLSNGDNALNQRIDFVLSRGFGRRGTLRGEIERVGENRTDRIAGPFHHIWPSDHAGLVATLVVRSPD